MCLALAYVATTTGSTSLPAFKVQLTNNGASNVDLTQVTIQYYFTAEGGTGLEAQINQAQLTTPGPPYYTTFTQAVQVTFAPLSPSKPTADTVLTFGFVAGAPLIPPGGVMEVDVQYDTAAFDVVFDQSNDYSYNGAGGMTFVPSQTLTVKVAGTLVWGVAP
jgi:hypothetical protein